MEWTGSECITMHNFVVIGQTITEILRFSRWWSSAILDFKKLLILTAGWVQRVKCVTVPNFVATGQTVASIWWFMNFFSIWRLSIILDLLRTCSDHTQRAFGGLHQCAKFDWNRCSSVDNMHFYILWVWLKMPIHVPKTGILGIWP